jgi:hypothetical protein
MLARVQRGLETLYRFDTGVAIDDFVVGADVRDDLVPARRPREQLLVCEGDGEMSLALFIDPDAIANLQRNDPAHRLDDTNLGDFLLAVEVSVTSSTRSGARRVIARSPSSSSSSRPRSTSTSRAC